MHYNLVESHRRAIVLLVIMHRNLQVAISAMRPVQCTFPHSLSHSLSLSLSLSLALSFFLSFSPPPVFQPLARAGMI